MMADRCAVPPGFCANCTLGNPLDPVVGFQMIETLAMGAERFKLHMIAGDFAGGRFQQVDLIEIQAKYGSSARLVSTGSYINNSGLTPMD